MNEENDLGGNGDTRNKSQEDTKNEENKSSSQVSKATLFSVISEKRLFYTPQIEWILIVLLCLCNIQSGRGTENRYEDIRDDEMESNDRRMQSESEPVDNEYYNFLHVSRNATPEEITAAYKKLSRLYHPDKHIEEQKKQQALIMFTKLKNSYEGK